MPDRRASRACPARRRTGAPAGHPRLRPRPRRRPGDPARAARRPGSTSSASRPWPAMPALGGDDPQRAPGADAPRTPGHPGGRGRGPAPRPASRSIPSRSSTARPGWTAQTCPSPAFDVRPESAIELTAALVRASDLPVTLVPTGPLTNVALFLRAFPALHDRIGAISLMGGSLGVGNTTASAEFNIWQDPEAAAIVFESGMPILMSGLDVDPPDPRPARPTSRASRRSGRGPGGSSPT